MIKKLRKDRVKGIRKIILIVRPNQNLSPNRNRKEKIRAQRARDYPRNKFCKKNKEKNKRRDKKNRDKIKLIRRKKMMYQLLLNQNQVKGKIRAKARVTVTVKAKVKIKVGRKIKSRIKVKEKAKEKAKERAKENLQPSIKDNQQ